MAATDKFLIVDFYADWCGPCRALSPFLAKLAENPNNRLLKINVDTYPTVGALYKVSALPTIKIYSGDESFISSVTTAFTTFMENGVPPTDTDPSLSSDVVTIIGAKRDEIAAAVIPKTSLSYTLPETPSFIPSYTPPYTPSYTPSYTPPYTPSYTPPFVM